MATSRVVAPAPPRGEQRLKMSYEEFLAWADEDVHAEWVHGEVIVFMPPKTRHQLIAWFLSSLLGLYIDFFRLGHLLTAPFEMKVSPGGSAREPDILFVATSNLARLTDRRLVGPADLIIELVSEESVKRDNEEKRLEYEAAGVKEYWSIDTRPRHPRARFWVLDAAGHYREVKGDADSVYRSTVVPGFWLRVAWLWQEPLPELQQTFAEVAGFPPSVVEELRKLAERGPQAE